MTNPSTASSTQSYFFGMKLTKRHKLTSWSLIVVFLIIVWVSGSSWHTPTSSMPIVETNSNPPLEVSTMVATQVDHYIRARSYTGLIREARRSKVSFKRGGEVVKLLVDECEHIEQGQLLAELDDRHIRANQRQLAAELAEAEAMLEELLAGPRTETIAAKRAELKSLEAHSAILKKQLARREKLINSASVSREEYETFLYDLRAAEAQADVARRQLDEMLAGTRKEQIAAQSARVSKLQARLAYVAHDLEDTHLTAPFGGRISKRFIDEGTVVSDGTPVVELIDDDHLEAWIGLPTSSSASLYKDEYRELQVDGNTIKARILSLSPDVDRSTRTQNVILRLTNFPVRVLPGQVVRMLVNEHVEQAGFWVPTTALTRGKRGLWSVFVIEELGQGETIARRDVELLDTVGTRSFVRGTLQNGEHIVSSGTHRVVVGQQVISSKENIALANHEQSSHKN